MTQVSRKTALEMQEGKAAENTLERRLQILNELIAKTDVGTPEMKTRWQAEAEDIKEAIMLEYEIEEAAIEVERIYGQYNVTEAIVDAFLALTERVEWDPFYLDEPTDDKLRAIEGADDGADDRPSTQMREHGPY